MGFGIRVVPSTYPHPFVLLIWEACSSIFYVYWFHYIRDLLCFWSAIGCPRNKYSLSLVIYRLLCAAVCTIFSFPFYFCRMHLFSNTVLSVSPDRTPCSMSDRASSALYAVCVASFVLCSIFTLFAFLFRLQRYINAIVSPQ